MSATTANPLVPYAAVSAGVLSYLFYFKIGERHMSPFRYIQALLLAIGIGSIARSHYGLVSFAQAFNESLVAAGLYLLGLYSSMTVYRLCFNPLNAFPGPYFARLTKFNHVLINAKLDSHHNLLRLHRKYGKFVRVGPNDISVSDPDCVQVVSGPNTKCVKAQWYSQDSPLTSMHTTRDRGMHDRRRRIWAPAFSDKALRGYESRIEKYNDLFIRLMKDNEGQPINASKYFNYYSFDVMGELAFGKPFDMLESRQVHWAIDLLDEGMKPAGFGFPPWFFRFVIGIPGAAKGYWQFINFCSKRLDERIQSHSTANTKSKSPDITHTLIEHYLSLPPREKSLSTPMLQGDSRLIIVAGSDTTACTLVHLFYHLASKPQLQTRLRTEIQALFPQDSTPLDHANLIDCEYLNGLITETLRLNPPVPSGVFRKTPAEGVFVGKTWIPGDTVIQIPTFVMGHDEDCFAECEEFIPERWFEHEKGGKEGEGLVKHKDAFQPFSSGPFGCIGKNLALMELRLLTAQVIRRFDVKLADGETGQKLLRESTDHFTMGLADLNLVFTKRKSS